MRFLLIILTILSVLSASAQNYHLDTLKAKKVKADSARISGGSAIALEVTQGDSIVFIGNSITAYFGPPVLADAFTKTVIRDLIPYGFIEANYGISGSGLTTQIGNIPLKTALRRILCIEFGTNELEGGIDSATWRGQYIAFLDTAIARGWSPSQIVMISIFGSAANWHPPTSTYATQRGYNFVMKSLASQFGCTYVDCYESELNSFEFKYFSTPLEHPYNYQSLFAGHIISGAIKAMFNPTSQSSIVNGQSELAKITYKNPPEITYPGGRLLGIDSTGTVGVMTGLPAETWTRGRLNLGGALVFGNNLGNVTGSTGITNYDSTSGLVLAPHDTIESGLSNTNKNLLQLYDVNGSTVFQNRANGNYFFFIGAGAVGGNVLGVEITGANGDIVMSGTQLLSGPQATTRGAVYGGLDPYNFNTNNTTLINKYAGGNFLFNLSGGLSNGSITMGDWFPSGHLRLQAGGTYADPSYARFSVQDTTAGITVPAMTTAQRNAYVSVGQITSFASIAAGSGYTNGNYTGVAISATGLSIGAGATANVFVSGGVPAVTIVGKGRLFKVGDTMTINSAVIGGTGSGLSLKVSQVAGDGVIIFNVDTHKHNWYDVLFGWRAFADSLSIGGSTPTLQQVLAAGNVLTKSDTIIVGTNFLIEQVGSFGQHWLQTTTGSSRYSAGISSDVYSFGWVNTSGASPKGSAILVDSNNNITIGPGSGTQTPVLVANSPLEIGQGIWEGTATLTSTGGTLGQQFTTVFVDATSGNITVNLPPVSTSRNGAFGLEFHIKRIDASVNTVTVAANGSDTIDGSATILLTTLMSRTLVAGASGKWFIL